MRILRFITLVAIGMPLGLDAQSTTAEARSPASNGSQIARSVVRINVTTREPDYRSPWSPGGMSGGVGAGFVIAGNRVMTNAHVVSNAVFISLERNGDPRRYAARVQHIAHDCDLAVLEVDDDRFFKDMPALQFGGVPEIESTVFAYGFPIGGRRYSVTRGVVSRIDFQTYAHSDIDAHLAIQIDAAINPGNSGGPVVQDGKVVGVAFQGYSGDVAQNVGYMIPTPVIDRFLRDIEDGSYDHYVDLAMNFLRLYNPGLRRSLELQDDGRGVMVTNTFADGSTHGLLKVGDVLLAIDNHPITADGLVDLGDGLVDLFEIVERKLKGESVQFTLLREGKEQTVVVPLKPIWPAIMNANRYDEDPSFLVFGGLVFQPLSRPLVEAFGINDLRVRYFYERFIDEQLYVDRPEVCVLSSILPDPINTELGGLVYQIVDKVNGNPIRTFEDLDKALSGDPDEWVIELVGSARPIVLRRSDVEAARERILETYSIPLERRVKKLERFQ